MRIIKKIARLVSSLYEALLYRNFYQRSYAQEGEDLILDRIFGANPTGFYIDIGSHHPVRFSNTFLFYKRGWSGICIDPSPETARLFRKVRPRDITLEVGISNCEKSLTYIVFDEPALNTFNQDLADQRVNETPYRIIDKQQVSVTLLSKVLDKFLGENGSIDFMSIDVEGLDLAVLESNNWSKYRPKWILVEQLSLRNLENLDFDIHKFMKVQGYVLFAKTFNTLFYKEQSIPI